MPVDMFAHLDSKPTACSGDGLVDPAMAVPARFESDAAVRAGNAVRDELQKLKPRSAADSGFSPTATASTIRSGQEFGFRKGVFAGRRPQSTSARITAATVSLTVSPGNARLHVEEREGVVIVRGAATGFLFTAAAVS